MPLVATQAMLLLLEATFLHMMRMFRICVDSDSPLTGPRQFSLRLLGLLQETEEKTIPLNNKLSRQKVYENLLALTMLSSKAFYTVLWTERVCSTLVGRVL